MPVLMATGLHNTAGLTLKPKDRLLLYLPSTQIQSTCPREPLAPTQTMAAYIGVPWMLSVGVSLGSRLVPAVLPTNGSTSIFPLPSSIHASCWEQLVEVCLRAVIQGGGKD